jgi:5-hydroxyisourate hydrolase
MARLSTHVLDIARGAPAAGVAIELHRVVGGQRELVASAVTNSDGRTSPPLIGDGRMEPGVYELLFRAADYFRASGVPLPDPPFFDEIVVRVGLADPSADYHVPLLLSPYGYSTYRGT